VPDLTTDGSAASCAELSPLLDRRESQVVQPAALDPREPLVELGQRRAAPERERLLQQA
jgi:hypothetical protein